MAMLPEAATMPEASFRSYPKARISGMAIAPMVAAEATLEPQQAPNPALSDEGGDALPAQEAWKTTSGRWKQQSSPVMPALKPKCPMMIKSGTTAKR